MITRHRQILNIMGDEARKKKTALIISTARPLLSLDGIVVHVKATHSGQLVGTCL